MYLRSSNDRSDKRIRVLFIARYRDATMSRKVEMLAEHPDLMIWYVCPKHYEDEFVQLEQTDSESESLRQIALPMIGRATDPHRALYRTLLFGMNRFKPDIVHAEEEPDSLSALQIAVARRLAAPKAKLVFSTWQNVDRPKSWYVRWVLRTALGAADVMLCANQEAITLLRQEGYRKEARLIPPIGVDTRIFVPCQNANRDREPFVVGYVGRLAPEKGVGLLISAVSQLNGELRSSDNLPKSIQLRIVGAGSERRRLEEQTRQAGLSEHVEFAPAMPPAQVAKYLCELDVVVLPSLRTPVWEEQFGRILVEAMACKVPVIGADSGAIPEVIGDAGLIFTTGDTKSLASSLHKLMESPVLCKELAEKGYTRVMQYYSQKHIAQQTSDFYRDILASR